MIEHKKPINKNFATVFLSIVMFFTGACGLIYEYVMSSLSTFILGNSIEQFSLIIGIMMFMMAVAGWVQTQFTDKNLIEKFIIIEILLALVGGFAPIITYYAYSQINNHFMLIMYISIISIGFLIGLEIPLATRINEIYVKSLKKNIATVWAFDYVGSLIGAFVFALFLIKTFAITQTAILIALINFFVGLITYLFFSNYIKLNHKIIIPTLIITFTLLTAGLLNQSSFDEKLEQSLYKDKIIYAQSSKYQRLIMTHNNALNDYRLYINGNLQFSSIDEKRYHELLVHPAMKLAKSHNEILILGGGDGLALREINKYNDTKQITLVDIDPEMIKVAKNNPIFQKLNNNSFNNSKIIETTFLLNELKNTSKINNLSEIIIYTTDATKFIDIDKKKYDIIIIDLPDPSTIELTKLYSLEFYQKLYNSLNDKGIIVIQSTSPFYAKKTYLSIDKTLQAAKFITIPYRHNIPSFGEWGWIMAFKETNLETFENAKNLKSFQIKTNYLTPGIFKGSLEFEKNFFNQKVNINSLLKPSILTYYIDESWQYK